MSKGIELILVNKQEFVISPIAEPIVVEGFFVAVKVRHYEPKFTLLEIL
jgi:hypothetical protein